MADYKEIFEKVPEGLTLHDADDGTILDANEQFCEQLGYTREELLDLDFRELHINEPPYTSEQAEEHIRKAATEGPQSFEWLDQTKSGEPLPVEVNLRQTTIEGEQRILAAVRDITDRKKRERELRQKSERLEEFAGMVSHDLRNPLNVLEGRLELAREDCDCEHYEAMASAVERMNELIDDLLTMVREGELDTQQDTHQLAEICNSSWLNVDTEDATLTIQDDIPLRGDAGRLQQLFENLFRNAVVHGGGTLPSPLGNLSRVKGSMWKTMDRAFPSMTKMSCSTQPTQPGKRRVELASASSSGWSIVTSGPSTLLREPMGVLGLNSLTLQPISSLLTPVLDRQSRGWG